MENDVTFQPLRHIHLSLSLSLSLSVLTDPSWKHEEATKKEGHRPNNAVVKQSRNVGSAKDRTRGN